MKGQLEEAMSKARFTKGEFYVEYRDFKELVRLPVNEFYKIAEIVPTHRIARILEYKDLGELDGGEKRSFDIIPLRTILTGFCLKQFDNPLPLFCRLEPVNDVWPRFYHIMRSDVDYAMLVHPNRDVLAVSFFLYE